MESGTGKVTKVVTDSRLIRAGEFFVALRGEQFDGHAFLPAVREAAAAGALVSESECPLERVHPNRSAGDPGRAATTCPGVSKSASAQGDWCYRKQRQNKHERDDRVGAWRKDFLSSRRSGTIITI